MKASVFNFGMKYGDSPRKTVRFLAGCCRKWEQWKADCIEREIPEGKSQWNVRTGFRSDLKEYT